MNPSLPGLCPAMAQKVRVCGMRRRQHNSGFPRLTYRRWRQMAESPYKMTIQSETHPAQSYYESQSKCFGVWTLAESLMYAIVFVVAPCREWFEWALVRQEAPGRCSGSPGSCKHYNLDVDHRDSPLLSLHYTEQTTMPLQNFFSQKKHAPILPRHRGLA